MRDAYRAGFIKACDDRGISLGDIAATTGGAALGGLGVAAPAVADRAGGQYGKLISQTLGSMAPADQTTMRGIINGKTPEAWADMVDYFKTKTGLSWPHTPPTYAWGKVLKALRHLAIPKPYAIPAGIAAAGATGAGAYALKRHLEPEPTLMDRIKHLLH